MQKAQEQIAAQHFDKAEKYFLKSIDAAPQFPDAYGALGHFYETQKAYKKASDLFSRATRSCSKCADVFALPLANALWRAGEVSKAEQVLKSWRRPDSLPPKIRQEIALLNKNIQFCKYALHVAPTATPVNMGQRVNSEFDEYFPSISQDDSNLVFTRKTNGIDQDFYQAHRDSCGGWFEARDMGSPPNSPQQEGAQMISADGHYLFFMRCGNRSPNGWEAGGCDLYFSYTKGKSWSQPVPFGATINTPAFEGMPSLSSDNRTLYFVSDRTGGYGGKDIWVTVFKDGLWHVPQNLGPEINTAGDETAPWIAPDNKTLYFTSNGHPGLGGQDIYVSRKNKNNNTWGKAADLGYPLNSAYDDVSFCPGADGTKGYFSSNRPGGVGGLDLYEVALDGINQPEPYTFLYGIVKDSLTGQRLTYAQIKWNDPATGELLYHYQSNGGDASYLEAIALNHKLALHVYRVGYLDLYDTLTFVKSNIYPPDTLNFALLPDYYQPPLTDTLLFRYSFSNGSAALNDSIITVLKQLVKPFIGQPYAEYFINGFTDDSGTPAINEEISFSRAHAVGNVLFNLGIDENKIHMQGWSDANPLVPNDSEAHRQLNRRVELVVRRPQK